jgi:hypothetical protein
VIVRIDGKKNRFSKSEASPSSYWSIPNFLDLVYDTQYTPFIFYTESTIPVLFYLKITDVNVVKIKKRPQIVYLVTYLSPPTRCSSALASNKYITN